MSKLNVLVAGASIAGPATAYWLARAGAKVTVIERFPHFRTSGQNVDIRAGGLTIMRRTPGMEEAVRRNTTGMEGVKFVHADGREYGTIRTSGDPDRQSIASEYEIFRGSLAQIIMDLTRPFKENVKYVFGEQIAGIEPCAKTADVNGPVTVRFKNGYPDSEYDLVVACDGAHSRTRAIGLDCKITDYVHPTNNWTIYCTITKDLLEGGKVATAINAPGGRFISLAPDPSGDNRVGIMDIHPASDRECTRQLREAQAAGEDTFRRFIAARYRDVGWKSREITDLILSSPDFYGGEVVNVRPPSVINLSKRFALVGDAGYGAAFTGTGTALALTGAYVLAGELARHAGDVHAGLKAYESTMAPLIQKMHKSPRYLPNFLAPQSQWAITLRNWGFGLVASVLDLSVFKGLLASSSASEGKQTKKNQVGRDRYAKLIPEYQFRF